MNAVGRILTIGMALGGIFHAVSTTPVSAETPQKTPPADPNFIASAFYEIGTEYLFGFTQGTDIGQPGEKEVGWKSVGAFNKRMGNYKAWEHELEFSYTATEHIYLALGILGVSAAVTNVPGLDDRHVNAFSGLSGELRWLIINRGPGRPIGLTLAVEPEWSRIDDGDGSRVRKYAVETTLAADTELVPDRLYLGANVTYEPEVLHVPGAVEHESSLTFRTALSYRVLPWLAIGPEFQHMRAYDMGIGLNHYVGYANFVGPSLYLAFGPKATLTLSWGHQMRGKSIEEPDQKLNLVDFSRDIGRIKANFEF